MGNRKRAAVEPRPTMQRRLLITDQFTLFNLNRERIMRVDPVTFARARAIVANESARPQDANEIISAISSEASARLMNKAQLFCVDVAALKISEVDADGIDAMICILPTFGGQRRSDYFNARYVYVQFED